MSLITIVKPNWDAPVKVSACCTTRAGGVSLQPFDGLNLAGHVGDNEQSVTTNRSLLKDQLSLPAEPCWLSQTHSTRVASLERCGTYNADVDAAITRDVDTIAVVMTADCLPILLCNREATEVAAVHAGWRGLADGIIEKTLDKMNSGCGQLLAWIGPAISQPRFEVGDEVREIFARNNPAAEARFIANRPGHWLCDLPGLALDILAHQGVNSVKLSGLCSFEDETRFFSYRREKVTGRMASMIWINSTT
ncbi:MAG: peptidoglycan editing factor PgeF [Gammaproteobacteria bacterium]|nr:peptidoglycan editing factor PgeF [Gammaproteobacteria bacterium]